MIPAIIVLVIIALVIIVRNIVVVQQSRAYVWSGLAPSIKFGE